MSTLESKIIDLFGVVYRNLVREENDDVGASSDSRSALLSVLRRVGPCSMTNLSRHLRVSKSNITFLVDRLEQQGLLTRSTDPADRRRTLIQLTEQGQEDIQQTRILLVSRIQERLGTLSEEDQHYLEETLPKVLDILLKLYSAEIDKTYESEK